MVREKYDLDSWISLHFSGAWLQIFPLPAGRGSHGRWKPERLQRRPLPRIALRYSCVLEEGREAVGGESGKERRS